MRSVSSKIATVTCVHWHFSTLYKSLKILLLTHHKHFPRHTKLISQQLFYALLLPLASIFVPISVITDLTYAKQKGTSMVVPKRGRIMIMVVKSIVAALRCSGRKVKERREQIGGAAVLSSTSTTPPVPSGYSSEA
ncbi:hypothetical protein ACSQ67_010866 [Phaseolus vulgaris]